MTKRKKLAFNSEELTQNLKTSTGLGMSAFFSPPSPPPSKSARPEKVQKEQTKRSKPSKKSRRKLSGQAASQAKTQAHPPEKTEHIPSTDQLTGRVVSRPVAFYIPETIHKKIDEAVRYYQEKHGKKVDRSAVVSAVLGDPRLWTAKNLNQMTDKVIHQLTNRLTSRLSS